MCCRGLIKRFRSLISRTFRRSSRNNSPVEPWISEEAIAEESPKIDPSILPWKDITLDSEDTTRIIELPNQNNEGSTAKKELDESTDTNSIGMETISSYLAQQDQQVVCSDFVVSFEKQLSETLSDTNALSDICTTPKNLQSKFNKNISMNDSTDTNPIESKAILSTPQEQLIPTFFQESLSPIEIYEIISTPKKLEVGKFQPIIDDDLDLSKILTVEEVVENCLTFCVSAVVLADEEGVHHDDLQTYFVMVKGFCDAGEYSYLSDEDDE